MSGASGKTYLRKGENTEQAVRSEKKKKEKRRQKKVINIPVSISFREGKGGAPDARAEIHQQPVEETIVGQTCTLQPVEDPMLKQV